MDGSDCIIKSINEEYSTKYSKTFIKVEIDQINDWGEPLHRPGQKIKKGKKKAEKKESFI